jgi:hypothetical protein
MLVYVSLSEFLYVLGCIVAHQSHIISGSCCSGSNNGFGDTFFVSSHGQQRFDK